VALAVTGSAGGVTVAPTTANVNVVTTTPITLTSTTSVTPGTYNFGLQGTGGTISAAANLMLTVNLQPQHPGLLLDASELTTLRARAAANTPQQQALLAACNSLIGGTVNYPTQNTYPNLPDLGRVTNASLACQHS